LADSIFNTFLPSPHDDPQAAARPGTEGYASSFVEMFAMVFSMPAWDAWWRLLLPSVNPYGWGYDLWYDNWARQEVPGHKMGIISTQTVIHEQVGLSAFAFSSILYYIYIYIYIYIYMSINNPCPALGVDHETSKPSQGD
jgi:hypothetical protein